VPGALVGALGAVALPPRVLELLLVLVTAVSLARALGKLTLHPPPCAMTPAGLVIGGLAGGAGGAGVLTAPLFLSAGLVGEAYTGTIAVSGVAMHFGRLAGYGVGGLWTPALWKWSALLAVAVLAGNQLGRRLRPWAARLPEGLLEHAALVLSVVLTLIGLG
jgi:hypothetical protein